MKSIMKISAVILICNFCLAIALGGGDKMNIETIMILKDILKIVLITSGILMLVAFLIED